MARDDEIAMRVTMTRHLNSRCKGLLELGPDNRVQFLHRLVKDYLDSRDIQRRLEEATGDFDAHLKYCVAYLSALKSTISEHHDFDSVAPQVRLCFVRGRRSLEEQSSDIAILGRPEQTRSWR